MIDRLEILVIKEAEYEATKHLEKYENGNKFPVCNEAWAICKVILHRNDVDPYKGSDHYESVDLFKKTFLNKVTETLESWKKEGIIDGF